MSTTSVNKMNIRKEFKKWITDNDLTISEFSGFLGISREYLYLIFNGKRNPSKRLTEKIKKYTNNDIDFTSVKRIVQKPKAIDKELELRRIFNKPSLEDILS